MSRSKRATSSVSQRVSDDEGYARVQVTVLTTPEHLRRRYWSDVALWRKHVKAFITYLKAEHGFMYGYCRSHPTGDDLSVFAPHANLLWVQRPGWRGKLPVDMLRKAWAKIIGADVVVLHCQFIDTQSVKGRRKLQHCVKYIERPFAGWMWLGAWGCWYGKFPRGKYGGVYGDANTCPTCGEPYVLSIPTESDKPAMLLAAAACWAGRAPPAYFIDAPPTLKTA